MLTRQQLKKLHDEDLPLHIFEQDYVQALFLKELYKISEGLIFKGGTYLKHAHGLDRFSEDLDFTRISGSTEEEISEAAENMERYNIQAEVGKIQRGEQAISGRLQYQGPLYDGSDRSRGNIDLEISKRGDVFLDPEWNRLFFVYPEVRAVLCRGMEIREVLAEKLRALSMRSKGRDLYDVWYLIEQGVEVDNDLYRKKMEAVGEEPFIDLLGNEKAWKRDLDVLLVKPPSLEKVVEKVRQTLEKGGVLET